MSAGSDLKTPPTWNGKEDARKGALDYPNYWTRKTRTGHTIILDDTDGKEHVTIQHRSGAMFQMMPDGAIQVVAHNGQYNMVFGESKVKITGAQDITVEGDASFKVKGQHNTTVDGDSTLAIKGKYTVTAKSMNTVVAEQIDTVAGSETKKIDGSSTTQVVGAVSILSGRGMTLGSTGDDVGIGSAKNLGLAAKGTISLYSDGQASIKSLVDVAIDGAKIYLNTGVSKDARDEIDPKKPPQSGLELTWPTFDVPMS